MISSHSINNPQCPKYQQFYQPFLNAAAQIKPEKNNWSAWINLLTSSKAKKELYAPGQTKGLTTVSSSLVGLSKIAKPMFNYSQGLPNNNYTLIKI